MKYFLTILLAVGLIFSSVYAEEKTSETRKVCVNLQDKDGKPVMDPKTNKPKQECKEVKKHKKHDGTKIEDAKKDIKN
ncbi:hypothetical protein EB118_10085 [bacterium]|nr:hypothetical protein [bacterium]